jgi:hypothetical protein
MKLTRTFRVINHESATRSETNWTRDTQAQAQISINYYVERLFAASEILIFSNSHIPIVYKQTVKFKTRPNRPLAFPPPTRSYGD